MVTATNTMISANRENRLSRVTLFATDCGGVETISVTLSVG